VRQLLKKYTLVGNILFYLGIVVFFIGFIFRETESTYQQYAKPVMIGGIVVILLTNFFRKKQPVKK
jgi:hypothetical protein